jgi:hypothetical protein
MKLIREKIYLISFPVEFLKPKPKLAIIITKYETAYITKSPNSNPKLSSLIKTKYTRSKNKMRYIRYVIIKISLPRLSMELLLNGMKIGINESNNKPKKKYSIYFMFQFCY